MATHLKDRVQERLDDLGINPFEAARRGELERNYVNDILNEKKRSVRGENLNRLAAALECEPAFLLQEESAGDRPPRLVPIIGSVGANPDGTVLYAMGQEAGDLAPVPPGGSSKASALEVKGHSMRGWADDGSLIYFEEQRTTPAPDMLGHVVVVELDTGEVLVKRLLRGSKAGRYDLESIAGPTIPDARLKWVAEITAVVPPKHAKRIIVRAGHAAA